MNIIIEIECETINEFYAHLTELKKQVKRKAKKLKLDPLRDEFPLTGLPNDGCDLDLYDGNCYGEHAVWIKETELNN